MVFANLNEREKQAFFSLLDEYFTSRPDILNGSESSNGSAENQAKAIGVAAARKAFQSNPQATANFVSAGLRAASSQNATSNDSPQNAFGRVAAASAAFNKPSPPPVLPRRTSPSSPSLASITPPPQPPAPAPKSTGASGLVANRKFGDVDVSSTKNALFSLRGSTAAKHANTQIAAPTPAALPKIGNKFAPPPMRRTGTNDSTNPPMPPRALEEEEAPEEEEEGEWAEALYDYSSEDPGDLQLQAQQRIKVIERTSDDWWTGELDGRRGLIPASYVQLL